MVISIKKSIWLLDLRNFILLCKIKWFFWCFECLSGGYEFISVNFYFLLFSGNFNLLVGKVSNLVIFKNFKNKWFWEVILYNVFDIDIFIILFYFMIVFMYMIINVIIFDLCFFVFLVIIIFFGYYYYNDDGFNYYVYYWEWWILNFDLVRFEL